MSARKVVIFRVSSDLQEAVNGEMPTNAVENRGATAARLIDLERRAQFGRYDSGTPKHGNSATKLAE